MNFLTVSSVMAAQPRQPKRKDASTEPPLYASSLGMDPVMEFEAHEWV
jgi:hypothetical protein